MSPGNLLFNYLRFTQFDLHKALMHYKLKKIEKEINGTWLDIGAGNLPYLKHFTLAKYLTTNTKRHYDTKAIDELDKLTTYWIEDGSQLPVENNSLDGLACFQVLSIIEKYEDFFSEINRVLKPGGKLILSTDFLYPVWSNEDCFRHTAHSLKKLCQTHGFDKIKTESFGSFGSTLYALKMRFIRSFPEVWKTKSLLSKFFYTFFYLYMLIILPLISLFGMFHYLFERNITNREDFTFNLMLYAEKEQPDYFEKVEK